MSRSRSAHRSPHGARIIPDLAFENPQYGLLG